MAEPLPEFIEGYSRADDSRIVIVGSEEVPELPMLVERYPGLLEPEGLAVLARMVTHFARGDGYAVIYDPAAFEAAYRARLDSEEKGVAWTQGPPRLTDFGVPSFAEIRPPRLEGGTLVFFATQDATGLPYRVRAEISDGVPVEPAYEPMPLSPVEGLGTASPSGAAVLEEPEEEEGPLRHDETLSADDDTEEASEDGTARD